MLSVFRCASANAHARRLRLTRSANRSKGSGVSTSTARQGQRLRFYSLGSEFFGEEGYVDLRQDTTAGDGVSGRMCPRGVTEQHVEIVVSLDDELNMPGRYSGAFVVPSQVPSQLENFSREVLEDGSEVHGRPGSQTSGKAAFFQKAGDSADRELETGLGRARDGLAALGLATSSLALSRHRLATTTAGNDHAR
jgi:hypothetical protein